jgi:hypothetical protein
MGSRRVTRPDASGRSAKIVMGQLLIALQLRFDGGAVEDGARQSKVSAAVLSPAGRPAWVQSFGSPLEGKMTVSPNIAGAWLMHHDQKLSAVKSTEFESIAIAGRAARLLSYLSKEVQWSIPTERVLALAQANGIRRHEVPGLLSELQTAGVIHQGANGISVLGVRQANLFHHANLDFSNKRSAPGLRI